MISRNELIKDVASKVSADNAAIFVGAGVSKGAGLPDWGELLKPLAESLNIDITKETNFPQVAQYIANNNQQNRIDQLLTNQIRNKEYLADGDELINILTRLPVDMYWTTNYDHLLERGFSLNEREIDKKMSTSNLSTTSQTADVTLYKMHGDIDNVGEIVLKQDDYDTYRKTRQPFITALSGFLVSRTFVFVGFSFSDPNVDFLLREIKIGLEDGKASSRTHYWITKVEDEETNPSTYEYRRNLQKLKEKDLERFGIQTYEVKSFAEIPKVFEDIERVVLAQNVLISGSLDADGYSDDWPQEKVALFLNKLTTGLIRKSFKIYTGFGLGVGSRVLEAAMAEASSMHKTSFSDVVVPRPFPQPTDTVTKEQLMDLWQVNREQTIAETGVVVFLFGNKKDENGKLVNASGVKSEFEIAQNMGRTLIPVPATGSMAKELFDMLERQHKLPGFLEKHSSELQNSKDVDLLVSVILKIVEEATEVN